MHMHDDVKRPIVLVADDDTLIRRTAEASLQESGFTVKSVESGELAVAEFRNLNPDLVLLDTIMPGMDGFAACSGIRNSPGGAHTPILMLLGVDDVESMKRAYDSGATDFQPKPVDWIALSQRVRYILRSSCVVETMRQSGEKNKALLAAIPDLILTLHRNGRVVDYKPSNEFDAIPVTEHFLNKPVEEILPREIAE
jgi:DNA-binding response OmpR family regulator